MRGSALRSVTLFCFLTAVGSAFPILQYIRNVKEPLGGLSGVDYLVYDSTDNLVYAGGYRIVVIDGATDQKVMSLPVPGWQLGYNPVHNKVYATGSDSLRIIDPASGNVLRSHPYSKDGQSKPAFAYSPEVDKMYYIPSRAFQAVVVIDGTSDSILGEIETGRYPFGLAYNPQRKKLYCADLVDHNIAVIDCATDSVLRYIDRSQGLGFRAITYDPNDDKIYCGSLDTLYAVDCATDSVVAAVETYVPWYLTHNPVENKLYYLQEQWERVWVLDCATDSVLGSIPLPSNCWVALGLWCNPAENKLYVACDPNYLVVFDCSADTVLAWQYTGTVHFDAPLCLNPLDEKLYCGTESGTVSVLDGRTDSLVATVITSDYNGLRYVTYDSMRNTVYAVNQHVGSITPIEGGSALPRHQRVVGVEPGPVVSAAGKLYCADHPTARITVLGGDDTVVGRIAAPEELGGPLCYVEPAGKLYCLASANGLAAIDVSVDSVVAFNEFPTWWLDDLTFNPASGMLYVRYEGGQVAVIDVIADSVVSILTVPCSVARWAVSETQNALYLQDHWSGSVFVLDCASDSIVATIVAPPGGRYSEMLWNPVSDKVYYAIDGPLLVVIDCRTNLVEAYPRIGSDCRNLELDPELNRVYCACSSAVWVIDGETNRVIAEVDIGGPVARDMAWCGPHRQMYVISSDTTISVIEDAVGSAEVPNGEWQAAGRPAVVRGCLRLPDADFRHSTFALLNSVGRRVMELVPGDNDVRGLAPGVYFVREEGPRVRGFQGPSVRKVVIAR